MKLFDYHEIEQMFVVGDVHGEFAELFDKIKFRVSGGQNIKDEIHPKELELRKKREEKERLRREAELSSEGENEEPYFGGIGRHVYGEGVKLDDYNGSNCHFECDNSVIIIAGDCGFGFEKFAHHERRFVKMNNILENSNTHILFVRGNHDDPDYFENEIVNLSNIKTIPDYSVVKLKNKNILCVGGAISVDRTWRLEQEVLINKYSKSKTKKLFWSNEAPVFNIEKLKEITDSNIKINGVVTHTCPSFAPPKIKRSSLNWMNVDENLDKDTKNERKVMDEIYSYLKDNGHEILFWVYGHFHYDENFVFEKTSFKMLADNLYLFNVKKLIQEKQLSTNNFKIKSVSGTLHNGYTIAIDGNNNGIVYRNDEERLHDRIRQIDDDNGNEEVAIAFNDALVDWHATQRLEGEPLPQAHDAAYWQPTQILRAVNQENIVDMVARINLNNNGIGIITNLNEMQVIGMDDNGVDE